MTATLHPETCLSNLDAAGSPPVSEGEGLFVHLEAFLASRSYAAASAKQRRVVLGRLIRELGDCAPGEVTLAGVLGWWASIQDASPATRRSSLSAANGFLAYLRALGLTTVDLRGVVAAPRVHQRNPVTLTEAEIRQLLTSLGSARDRAMVATQLGCGLRAMEVAAVDVEGVDLTERIMVVVGKGGRQRFVPIPVATVELLEDYLLERPAASGPLFRHHRSEHRVSPALVQRLVTEALWASGVKRHPFDGRSSHVLRRTLATQLLESGVSVRRVQAVLGHQSLNSTVHYLRLPDRDELLDAIDHGPDLGASLRGGGSVPGTRNAPDPVRAGGVKPM